MNLRQTVCDAIWEALDESPGVYADKENQTLRTWHSRESFDMRAVADNVLDRLGDAFIGLDANAARIFWGLD